MATEIEIKYKVLAAHKNNIRDLLKKYKSMGRNFEYNIMFDNEQKTMGREDARLRVRIISDAKDSQSSRIQFTYKKRLSVAKGIKKEEEIEVEFDTNSSEFIEILNKMGYRSVSSYERFRETLITSNGIKITYDEFPFGVVLEIEGDEKLLLELERDLGLTIKDRYALSCDDLYTELCLAQSKLPKNEISFVDKDMPSY